MTLIKDDAYWARVRAESAKAPPLSVETTRRLRDAGCPLPTRRTGEAVAS